MILKSIGIKKRSFQRVLEYVNRPYKVKEDAKSIVGKVFHYLNQSAKIQSAPILWNLRTTNHDLEAIRDEFALNSHHIPYRKNGNYFYHEIISLSDADHEKVTPRVLYDLAFKYFELRAPNALGYAVQHFDSNNPHIHLMLSANERKSAKKIRISKSRFQRIKKELEQYQREKYPELTASKVNHDPGQGQGIRYTRGEREGIRRLAKISKRPLTSKEKIFQKIKGCLSQSYSKPDFEKLLADAGFTLYQRGQTFGVRSKAKNRKYRLKTLGLQPFFQKSLEKWQATKDKMQNIKKIRKDRNQSFRLTNEINR